MPSTATITSSDLTDFVAGTTIRSSQVDNNFSVWRGHNLPVSTDTSTAATSGTYDLGSPDHCWRGVYQQYGVMNINSTSTSVATPATTTQYAIYFKDDGYLYKKTSVGLETAVGAGGGALGVTGSRASPSTITAAGLTYNTAGSARQMWFITGDTTTGTDITANPQITAGSTVGQELILVGRDSSRPVTFEDGNGLSLNGPNFIANANSTIGLVWDTSVWVEMFRRG